MSGHADRTRYVYELKSFLAGNLEQLSRSGGQKPEVVGCTAWEDRGLGSLENVATPARSPDVFSPSEVDGARGMWFRLERDHFAPVTEGGGGRASPGDIPPAPH